MPMAICPYCSTKLQIPGGMAPGMAPGMARQVLDGALFDVPIAVLHNKEDLPFALGDDEIAAALKWPELAAREGPIRAFRCSVLRGTGYTDALQWLARFC